MIQKSLGSTSVIRHNYNKACVQACLVNSYFYQQHENHLSTRSEQHCFQACRRSMWRSGYLYKVSILWSNYWHWENLVIRNEWAFFVCKQIAFWFIRDAPLRTNCSRCCLCSQWLKGPTWISYERVTIAFNPVLYWTGMLLAGAAAWLEEQSLGAAHQLHNLLLEVLSQALGSGGAAAVATLYRAGHVPHGTTKMNPPTLKIVDMHYETSQQHLPSKNSERNSDDRNLCYKYPGSGNLIFLLCAHTSTETKQTAESKPEFPACTSHERFPIWGLLTVEGSGQEIRGRVTILFVLKMSGLTRWQVFKLMFISVKVNIPFGSCSIFCLLAIRGFFCGVCFFCF